MTFAHVDAAAWSERLKARGVEILSPVRPTAFEEEWYDIATSDHFWLKWRLTVLLNFLRNRRVSTDMPLRVLDVGGGLGVFRAQLEAATNWTVDLAELNCMAMDRIESGRGGTFYYDILEERSSLIGAYDLVFVFDVIEHLPEPTIFLRSSLAHLKSGGALLVNVPALEWCRSAFDAAVGHIRRYDAALMKREVTGLPLSELEMRYWGLSLVPILLLRQQVLRLNHTRGEILETGFKPSNRLVSLGMELIASVETALTECPPVGSSLMVFARKR